MAGQIVERVNAYFGHRMIDDIRLVQGADRRAAAAAPPRPAPDATTSGADRPSVPPTVKDPELRAALARLGARVAHRPARTCCWALVGRLARAARLRAQDLSRTSCWSALPGDHVLGKPDAPNTLIDYASFTCPHCAQLLHRRDADPAQGVDRHRQAAADPSPFPDRIVVATRASQLAECAGPDKFFEPWSTGCSAARSTG